MTVQFPSCLPEEPRMGMTTQAGLNHPLPRAGGETK